MAPLIAVISLLVSIGAADSSFSGGVASAELVASRGYGVDVCCAWGRPLVDGELTVAFAPGDPGAIASMRAAVLAWDSALPELTLREVAPDQRADVTIRHAGLATRTHGMAVVSYDRAGLIRRVRITLYGAPGPANAGAVEQVAKHELGHALGLDHARFGSDLMSPLVNPARTPIPACNLAAVREANRWRLLDHSSEPRPPVRRIVACGRSGP